MEENEYKKIYHLINQRRCPFEKGLLTRRCSCSVSRFINLAEREAVGCESESSHPVCQRFLDNLRTNSRFALRMTNIGQPLPHRKELKVQIGGLLGLQKTVDSKSRDADTANDIYTLVKKSLDIFHDLDQFPYSSLVQSIVKFQLRPKRN